MLISGGINNAARSKHATPELTFSTSRTLRDFLFV
jgi:hypothetical protein